MLLFKCVSKTNKKGKRGLFCSEKIAKNDVIWRLNPKTTGVFNKKQFLAFCENLSLTELKDAVNGAYLRNGVVYLPKDLRRFIDHSTFCNIALQNDKTIVALRDIEPGEELLCNYHTSYDKVSLHRLRLSSTLNREELLLQLRNLFLSGGRPKLNFHINRIRG
jgi:hypothetical protein